MSGLVDVHPVHVFGRQPDVLEGELDLVAILTRRRFDFADVFEVDARIEHFPGSEQPVRVVDEAVIGVFEPLGRGLPFGPRPVDEEIAPARFHVEIGFPRAALRIVALDAVAAIVSVPPV